MKDVFVETKNVSRFQAALAALGRRGADEARLVVVDGKPGLGKTTALERWATLNESVFMRAKREWTASWFLNDLIAALNTTPASRAKEARFGQAVDLMLARDARMMTARRKLLVVIDEADHIARKSDIVETIRDFADTAQVGFVFVGMQNFRASLARYPQVASRVSQYVGFEPADLDDVRLFVTRLSEVPVGECLIRFIAQTCRGYNREIKEAIATIEPFGRRNKATEERPVRLADLRGQVLMNDRVSGKPVLVPEDAK